MKRVRLLVLVATMLVLLLPLGALPNDDLEHDGHRVALPTPVDLKASQWQTATTLKKFSIAANDAAGDLVFTFPDDAYGRIGYLYTRRPYELTGFSVYEATFHVDVLAFDPIFVWASADNTCPNPAHVRLFLWGTQDANSEFARWWSHAGAQELQPGVFTIAADLNDLTDWSSVFGRFANDSAAATQGFKRAKASGLVGLTFGGGCFFGHGVGTTGGIAEFGLTNLEARWPREERGHGPNR
jgi:hypothetical protein